MSLKPGFVVKLSALLFSALILSACGGGGGGSTTVVPPVGGGGTGGGGGGTGGGQTGPDTTWVQNQFASSSDYVNYCEAPRTGIDPLTGLAYADMQGTALDEKFWMRSWSNELYYWYDEITDVDPHTVTDKLDYFDLLKTNGITPSGSAKDNFHFTADTEVFYQETQDGTSQGYGFYITAESELPPRKFIVSYIVPGTPAEDAGIERGDEIITVDGIDLVNSTNDQEVIDALDALAPLTNNVTHTLGVLKPNSTTTTYELTSTNFTTSSVFAISVYITGTGNVGYMAFNDHNATAEGELVEAFDIFQDESVTDLILDMRYNSGGYLSVAAQLGYMIAGESETAGKIFEEVSFNDKYPNTDPVTGLAIEPTMFISETTGLSLAAGDPLPSLDLRRVFVLTGSDTCSASESLINALTGIGIEVIQIGSTTCGKPYGFYPWDNCGTTYFSIQFAGVNDLGFGEFSDGFSPANTQGAKGVTLPGCSVADDYSHNLGDPAEALTQSALGYRSTGSCPLAPPPAPFSYSRGSTTNLLPVAYAPRSSFSSLKLYNAPTTAQ